MQNLNPLHPRAAKSVLERMIARGQAQETPALARLRAVTLPAPSAKTLPPEAGALIRQFGQHSARPEALVADLIKLLKP